MTPLNRDELALFLSTLHERLDATGSMMDALQALESSLGNTPSRDLASSLREGVSAGKSLFEALRIGPVPLPRTVLLLIEVAEEVGSCKVLSLLLSAAAGLVADGTALMPGDTPDADRKARMVRFWRLLTTILDCGVPLVRGLRTLQGEPLGDELCGCCDQVCNSVEAGSCLSDAMRELPETFSPSVCTMIRAGESGGVMDVACARITQGLADGTFPVPGMVAPEGSAAPPSLPWRALALMLTTGVPCGTAVDVLAEETQEGYGKELTAIADHIRNGDTLSEALRRCDWASADLCDAVAKGEQDGCLDDALAELAAALDQGEHSTPSPAAEVNGDGRPAEATKPMPQVVRLVDLILYQSVKDGASDIHFEPGEDDMTVRYRIDGMLCEMQPPPPDMRQAVVNRLKVMGNLNVAERRLPQDGRIEMRIAERRVDLRISTVPTIHGERVALRVLDREKISIPLDRIGFSPEDLARIRGLCDASHGLVVVTGPSGTGKTTLLYAMLEALQSPSRAILTVEDPVERPLSGIAQIPVRSAIGLTFPRALTSILRQAPNVIMIGDIRDPETLQIAAHAALSGQLVLASMPSDTAAQALRRMLDLGVEPHVLNAALSAVIALRLPRLLCTECRVACSPDMDGLPAAAVELLENLGESPHLYTAAGCPACGKTGYSGRTAICEILTLDDGVSRSLTADDSSEALHAAAVKAGMVPLLQNGLNKAGQGPISLEEVLRVAPDR